jgi:hypothetical protein
MPVSNMSWLKDKLMQLKVSQMLSLFLLCNSGPTDSDIILHVLCVCISEHSNILTFMFSVEIYQVPSL